LSVRTKILALLASVLLFFVTAGGVSLAIRSRAADALARAAEHDVRLLTTVTFVTADHLEQAIRLERALRTSRDRGESPEAAAAYEQSKAEYDAYAAEIWRKLQEAREVAGAVEGPDSLPTLALLERIDGAHNAYADEARGAFALLEAGSRREALSVARRASRHEDELEQALGALLMLVSTSTESASVAAHEDERLASGVIGFLIGAGLLLTLAVFTTVIRLVSDMKSLSGLLPICAHCKKIRDDRGYWNQLEAYLSEHSDAELTHGICADCQDHMHAEIAASRAQRHADAPA